MKECITAMLTPKETYSNDWYNIKEKEITEKINNLLEDFKNKFCIQPLVKIVSPDKVEVVIFNRLSEKDFVEKLKWSDIIETDHFAISEWNGKLTKHYNDGREEVIQ